MCWSNSVCQAAFVEGMDGATLQVVSLPQSLRKHMVVLVRLDPNMVEEQESSMKS